MGLAFGESAPRQAPKPVAGERPAGFAGGRRLAEWFSRERDRGAPDRQGGQGGGAPLRVLITGGAGFIGSHLAEALLARGDEVTVLDDLSTGRLDNLAAVTGHPRLRVQVGSVFEADLLQSLVDGVEGVYHLAASVGVRLILERPVETIENNILGTSAVLRAAVKGRRRVVIASSSEVYGKNDQVPLREDDDSLLGPTVKSRWSYACSKAIDEFLALAYWHGKEVPVVILRYFNTVGPRQTGRYGMVVPRLVGQALAGEPLTVYGDGRQTRSFTDVADAIRCTVLLADHPGAVGQVFNVGNGREVSILELAERIRALTGTAAPITFVPYEEAYGRGFEDLRRRVPEIAKARALVGYEPAVDLDETLRRVIADIRAQRGAA